MKLTHLSLENFRNFTRLDTTVPGGIVVLVGSNAQGKTSLLEAVYMLATLTSYHADSDRQLINFLVTDQSPAVARIVAEFKKNNRAHRLEIRVIQERVGTRGTTRVRKETLLDGLKQKAGDVIGHFNAVMFLPQMMRVVDGSPEHRRRYLNLALAQVAPGYMMALSGYRKLLTRRNALLKLLGERNGNGDASQLVYWDEQLTIHGAQIIHARIHAVQELGALAARAHSSLTRGREILRLEYRPSYDPLPAPKGQYALNLNDPRDRSAFTLEQIQRGFAGALAKRRGEEIARGVTTLGPHRDELRFLSNRVDLGTYGSRGQVRTAMLTLKLAELDWMKQKTGHWPILLLDEVLAELDNDRRGDLLARVENSEQALLTTTDLGLFTEQFVQGANIWGIENGRVQIPAR